MDLEGGFHLVYKADFSELPEGQDEDDAMDGVIAVIEKRVDAYGVSESVIRKMGDDRILVQLPGIDDIAEAKDRIGKTVLINFKEFVRYMPTTTPTPLPPSDSGTPTQDSEVDDPVQPNNSGSPAQLSSTGTPVQIAESGSPVQIANSGTPVPTVYSDDDMFFVQRLDDDDKVVLTEVKRGDIQDRESAWIAVPAVGTVDGNEIELTSQYFKGGVEFTIPQNGQPTIHFEWDDTGSDLFWQITTRLSSELDGSVERKLGIFLGDEYVSSPNVNEPIRDSGIITGMAKGEAKRLTSLLNAGRIDVPLHTMEQWAVKSTLGKNFVDWSVQAGVIGLILIILFLIMYYRLPGALAGLALLIYVTLVMAVYQLWPVTLTLAGIAGFILSIGMAVDANVLIFERMKEEIRMGRTLRAAIEVGFNRAWPAIRDSNFSTFITCGILYWMGSTLTVPSVQGFALTLFIGVAISMFSAIVITKTFMRFLGNTRLVDKKELFIASTEGLMLSREGR